MSSPPPDLQSPPNPVAPRSGSRVGSLVVSRRVRTLAVSGLLFLGLLAAAMTLPVPYVVLSPGPTYNTLGTYQVSGKDEPIISVLGRTTNRTSGNLNLTTVSYSTAKLTVFDALSAWLQSDEVVVPRASLFPPGQSTGSVDKKNSADFAQSQDKAVIAASCELGYPKSFGITQVDPQGASAGVLRTGDVFVSVDGTATPDYAALKAVLGKLAPGAKAQVAVTRGGTRVTAPVTLGPPPKGGTGGSLGVGVSTQCLAPFEVDLGLGNEIGGPSAGLMFALGIIDKVGKADLTSGRFIAGTGTIDADGVVGPIGGIQLKMIAAREAGASVFLAPADNCSDVNGAVPDGLQVVKVTTLHDAVQSLGALEKGQSVPHC